jgi:sugar (pentulose or hexulose) kinase
LSNHLGLDVGTTTITAIIVDSNTGACLAKATAPNDSEITSEADRRLGRSEWNADRVLEVLRDVLSEVSRSGHVVGAIGVTGQMHGMLLVDSECRAIGPFVGWQDQRAAEVPPDGGDPVIARLLKTACEVDPDGDVCRPKTGYMGATLSWMGVNRRLPEVLFSACFLPDFVAARLTGSRPVTDATNAAGSGLFDVKARAWCIQLIERMDLREDMLPAVVDSGTQAGGLAVDWADTGLAPGIPVCVACGDNQASFLGSVSDPDRSILINVGTGGQVSVSAVSTRVGPGLEARPHVDGQYLLVGAGLVGGRTYAWLRDFYLEVGRQLFDVDGDAEAVYERMTDLADRVAPGAEGLWVEPLLTGTREEPGRRGKMDGIGTANFSPGHLSRAVLEGMIAQFRQLYELGVKAVGLEERSLLVGAGNGIRKNKVLREIAKAQFGLRMQVPAHTEEAAFGAAMLAMVMSGDKASLKEAGEIVRYSD